MKAGFLSILFLAYAFSLHAKCGSEGIWVTGDNRLVFKNSIIILEFYEGSMPIANGLNKKYPVYLQAGAEKIPLTVKEIMPGSFRLTQVILITTEQPAYNKKYTLVIGNLKKDDARPEYYNFDLQKREPYVFSGIAPPLAESILFTTAPSEFKKTMVSYGCGPAQWVYYRQSNNIPVASYIKACLKDKTTGIVNYFFLAPGKDGTIRLGHGMCSGSFSFTDEHQYEVSFTPVDLSGNTGETTSPLSLTAIFKETGEE